LVAVVNKMVNFFLFTRPVQQVSHEILEKLHRKTFVVIVNYVVWGIQQGLT